MQTVIRAMHSDDVPSINLLIDGDTAFNVSTGSLVDARFTKRELTQWSSDKEHNITFVATNCDKVVGFIMAHLMNDEWAYIDALYVLPDMRKYGVGRQLWLALRNEAETREITYVSGLAHKKDVQTQDIMKHWGFSQDETYVWLGIEIV
jgi:ribosomal protein S18 acetylase RimI-like enzyme